MSVKGYSICSADECWNHYPRSEANEGTKQCPPCRGENRTPTRVEVDDVAGMRTEGYDE